MADATQSSKGLNITLWVLQVILAGMFGMAGMMKATAPIEQLIKNMAWVAAVPAGLVRFIGISELLGALGLLLPALTRIKPGLTALAAAGLFTVMILAFGFHIMRGETAMAPIPLVLGLLSLFVAWGRYSKAPIQPRS